jgi:hypothetical protein
LESEDVVDFEELESGLPDPELPDPELPDPEEEVPESFDEPDSPDPDEEESESFFSLPVDSGERDPPFELERLSVL